MLSFLKKIFGAKPVVETPAPYKVEVGQFPFPKTEQDNKSSKAKKPAAKKPAVAKKPSAPKKPKS
jgi:hypothetical protein